MRSTRHVALLLVWGACATATGCFFSGGINEAPIAEIDRVQQVTVHRGDGVAFRANKSTDPDGDSLTVDWAARACAAGGELCDAQTIAENTNFSVGANFSFTVPTARAELDGNDVPLPVEAIRVEIAVTDPSGAESTDFMVVDIVNQEPDVDIDDQGYKPPQGGGYPLGVEVEFIATGSDGDAVDVDDLSYEWQLVSRPNGSVPQNVVWQPIVLPGADSAYRLVADIPGQWDIEVTVTDPLGASQARQKTVFIEADRPPCIRSTDPFATTDGNYIVDTGEVPRRFGVGSVDDDLDFYPAPNDTLEGLLGAAEFTWFISSPATNNQWTQIVNHEVADYLVDPSAYDPGDTLQLRVEVDDRVGRDIICDPALPTCAIGTDTECLQRVTWGVEIR